MAIGLEQAIQIVESFLDGEAGGDGNRLVVLRELTIEKEYGWVFFWDSRLHAETGDDRYLLAGNAPVLVERDGGGLLVIGTGRPVQDYLDAYERDRRSSQSDRDLASVQDPLLPLDRRRVRALVVWRTVPVSTAELLAIRRFIPAFSARALQALRAELGAEPSLVLGTTWRRRGEVLQAAGVRLGLEVRLEPLPPDPTATDGLRFEIPDPGAGREGF